MADENVNENEIDEGTSAGAEVPSDEALTAEAESAAQAPEELVAEAEDTAPEAEEGASADAEAPSEDQEAAGPELEPAQEPDAADGPAEQVAEDTSAAAEAPSDGPEAAEPEPDATAEGGPSASSSAKPKKKRLPRALRPQRTRVTREKAAERKSITRLPKPEHARGRRQERQGAVVSAAGDKTIIVRVDTAKAHPMYKKVIRRSTRLHAHDEANEAKVGDIVRIVETRPLSKLKRWRLQEIVEAAK